MTLVSPHRGGLGDLMCDAEVPTHLVLKEGVSHHRLLSIWENLQVSGCWGEAELAAAPWSSECGVHGTHSLVGVF